VLLLEGDSSGRFFASPMGEKWVTGFFSQGNAFFCTGECLQICRMVNGYFYDHHSLLHHIHTKIGSNMVHAE
jgi:hypothetical protein